MFLRLPHTRSTALQPRPPCLRNHIYTLFLHQHRHHQHRHSRPPRLLCDALHRGRPRRRIPRRHDMSPRRALRRHHPQCTRNHFRPHSCPLSVPSPGRRLSTSSFPGFHASQALPSGSMMFATSLGPLPGVPSRRANFSAPLSSPMSPTKPWPTVVISKVWAVS